VDGVEINPIIADEVMRGRFREFSGGIYTNPRVRIAVDDGRSFVRRTPEKYDVIQASLVDTWAATAAGAYTLTENTLYTVDAFSDYLDHLSDDGVLTITRWVADGLRLVSLAQEACARRGWSAADRLAVVRHENVATFLLKKKPFTTEETARLRAIADRLDFEVLYTPSTEPTYGRSSDTRQTTKPAEDVLVEGAATGDYARLITAADREKFYASYPADIRPTTDDRPFFFHTTKIRDQFDVAFGQKMLFGNGLSALMTLLGISAVLVALFVIGPLIVAGRGQARPHGWLAWLVYFGSLGAGFMLIEVSVLQNFVLLLGHPVYSLTVTLFSLLLGTGLGAGWSRRLDEVSLRRSGAQAILSLRYCAGVHRDRPADRQLGYPVSARRSDGRGGRDAGPHRRGAGNSDADRPSDAERTVATDAAVGMGNQRRALRPRSHPRHLHRHELGFPGDAHHRRQHLPHRPCRPSRRYPPVGL
jgi:hypothetical protein